MLNKQQLNKQLESCCIPFWSIQGPFRSQFWNAQILPDWECTGMKKLAGLPAKFYSTGFHGIPPEWPESNRNRGGTNKSSLTPHTIDASGSVTAGPGQLTMAMHYSLIGHVGGLLVVVLSSRCCSLFIRTLRAVFRVQCAPPNKEMCSSPNEK